jgi:hypothetical protein
MMWMYVSLMAAACLIYTAIGVMLVVRATYEPLFRRSPGLVLISHLANFVEVELFLLTKSLFGAYEEPSQEFLSLYQAVMLVMHYLFYFPYVLRCYRLHFVFKLGQHWTDSDQPFYERRYRATQSWLVKLLLGLMVPFLIFALFLMFFPALSQAFPSTYTAHSETALVRMQAGNILCSFIEELFFILAVWQLRDVNDDFAMTSELTWVCMLWMTNSFLLTSLFPFEIWQISCIVRNFLIMLVSSFWPVYKSFSKPRVDVPLTLEALHNFELVMQSEASLEAFSHYLREGKFEAELAKISVRSGSLLQDSSDLEGYWLLEFWLECEVFKFNPSADKALGIIETYIVKRLVHLPTPTTQPLLSATALTEPSLFIGAQEFAFKLLADHYFPLFQRSASYSELLRDVVRRDIRLTRVASAYFPGHRG